jgi:hypothetical protein
MLIHAVCDGTTPLLQHAFGQPLGIALPGFRKLDDLSSDGVTGRIDTVSVSQRHKSHLEGDTHDTSSLGVEPKAVTLVKEAFENSHGC